MVSAVDITSAPCALEAGFSSSQHPQPATAMFTLFPQLPIDIRRKIWLATLGPMMLTFTNRGPPPMQYNLFSDETPTWTTESRYVGNVSLPDGDYVPLPDGDYKLFFVVEASAAYLACQESRAFLRYVFAEPVKPDGGLPSWFDPAIDTVRFTREHLVPLSRYPWFKQAQHLWIRLYYDAVEFCSSGPSSIPEYEDKTLGWLENNLSSLKYITFQMMRVDRGEWIEEWFPVFETWFNHVRWEPVSFSARVISYEDDIPKEEWITPQNYLLVEKQVMSRHYQRCHPVPNWKEKIQRERTRCLVEASDEELENPGEFLKKHKHFGE